MSFEERFADQGGPVRARGESDLRGLERPREASVYTDVDSDVRDVPCKLSRFFATSGAERHEDCGVAVDPTFDIERRFAVSDQDAYRHLANLPAADGTQPHHHALRVGSWCRRPRRRAVGARLYRPGR